MAPWAPLPGCKYPLCPKISAPGHGGYCIDHKEYKQADRKQYDSTRGTSTERGYSARWVRTSKMFLRSHPLCIACLENDVVCAAECVDHRIPHRGNYELFWDESNWQALCLRHHNAKSAKGD